MRVRFTATASNEIALILTDLGQKNLSAADRVASRIRDLVERLREFPLSGAPTDNPDVRVAVLIPFPYLVFYMVQGDYLIVRNVRHAARKRP